MHNAPSDIDAYYQYISRINAPSTLPGIVIDPLSYLHHLGYIDLVLLDLLFAHVISSYDEAPTEVGTKPGLFVVALDIAIFHTSEGLAISAVGWHADGTEVQSADQDRG